MPFDHADAATQIAGITDYAGRACTIEGRSGSFAAVFEDESAQESLEAHGTDETIETRISVSTADFPKAPVFGRLLTRTDDGRRYRVGPSYRTAGGWSTRLHVLDRSTPSHDDNQFPIV